MPRTALYLFTYTDGTKWQPDVDEWYSSAYQTVQWHRVSLYELLRCVEWATSMRRPEVRELALYHVFSHHKEEFRQLLIAKCNGTLLDDPMRDWPRDLLLDMMCRDK